MRSLLTSAAAALGAALLAVAAPLPALAAPKAAAVAPTGNDVSWPQCAGTGSAVGALPTAQAFGIVGLNDGLANTTNPCFAAEWSWALSSKGGTAQPKASVYVNTANPGLAGSWWPRSNSAENDPVPVPVPAQYGTCTGTASAACAYVYGWSKAYDDLHLRNAPTVPSLRWWLDVETMNSWSSTDLVANRADLEAMVTVLRASGGTVGIYSTRYQLSAIVGAVPAGSPLAGLDSWLAGASSLKSAQSLCTSTPLTAGSRVVLTQYVARGFDYDVSCAG